MLALFGGSPIRTRPFPSWPIFGKPEEDRLLCALRSGEWGRLDGHHQVEEFERRFAAIHGCGHGVAVVNGTISPYVLNALLLTATTYGLMTWGLIRRPFINVPWTTPPILGHYLVTGGDWRAAVWGVVSIALAWRCTTRSRVPRPRAAAVRPGRT